MLYLGSVSATGDHHAIFGFRVSNWGSPCYIWVPCQQLGITMLYLGFVPATGDHHAIFGFRASNCGLPCYIWVSCQQLRITMLYLGFVPAGGDHHAIFGFRASNWGSPCYIWVSRQQLGITMLYLGLNFAETHKLLLSCSAADGFHRPMLCPALNSNNNFTSCRVVKASTVIVCSYNYSASSSKEIRVRSCTPALCLFDRLWH